MSWDLVLGFFPEEVQKLILDTTISDLMINGRLASMQTGTAWCNISRSPAP